MPDPVTPRDEEKRYLRMEKDLSEAVDAEKTSFSIAFRWLKTYMPQTFHENINPNLLSTIAHNLVNLHLQNYFIPIDLNEFSIILSLDTPETDVKILERFKYYAIRNYRSYNSIAPLPSFKKTLLPKNKNLKITFIHLTQFVIKYNIDDIFDKETLNELYNETAQYQKELDFEQFKSLLGKMNLSFLKNLKSNELSDALEMYFKAQKRDYLQYKVTYNENFRKENTSSMQIMFAWKNTPKYNFLYRLVKLIFNKNLVLNQTLASYVKLEKNQTILLMRISLDGMNKKIPAWEATDIEDFLQELCTIKYLENEDIYSETFNNPNDMTGNQRNLLRSLVRLVHQFLLHKNPSKYSLRNISETVTSHYNLSIEIVKLFGYKFSKNPDINKYDQEKNLLLDRIGHLDTGVLSEDERTKDVFTMLVNSIEFIQKTNFYRENKSALGYRIDPDIMLSLPYNWRSIFPRIPFGIFFIDAKYMRSFHVRFGDTARGGVRTFSVRSKEEAYWEGNTILSEAYNLALTQDLKNKDLPEDGAKALIHIDSLKELKQETEIYKKEIATDLNNEEIDEKIATYRKLRQQILIEEAQQAFFYTMITLVNYDDKTKKLRTSDIQDYYKKKEIIFFGPDEMCSTSLINWLAEHSEFTMYQAGRAVISSKPDDGFNHKEYGVTSLGVFQYMIKLLQYQGVDPENETFTIKMTGGPNGDVAGNMMMLLAEHFPNTAQILCVKDGSGFIFDPIGLSNKHLAKLAKEGKSITAFPPSELSNGSILIDLTQRKAADSFTYLTKQVTVENNKVKTSYIPSSDAHHIYHYSLHETKTVLFIPAGGRPHTITLNNINEFIGPEGEPTSKLIVEGANLYFTDKARTFLEEKGALIVQDLAANKAGVITSSLEVQSSYIVPNKEFKESKELIVKDVLTYITEKCNLEADALFKHHKKTGLPLTVISASLAKKINTYKAEILQALENIDLEDKSSLFNQILLDATLPFFAKNYRDNIFDKVPDSYKKSMIAAYISSYIIYTRGVDWNPSIADHLIPIIQKIINKK